MARSYSAALPIAGALLRLLTVLNLLYGVLILALLFIIPHEQWIMSNFKLTPSAAATRLVWGMRGVAGLWLLAIPVNHMILQRLLGIVETVRSGNPFVAANAERLYAIAWLLAALQILNIAIAVTGAVFTPVQPVDFDSGLAVAGWLAVLFAFILARVFAEGTSMDTDLQGTV